jgi:aminoglycoside 6'-N-acetyltransferase I
MFFDGHVFEDLCAVLIAESRPSAVIGFAELSIRDDLPELEGKRTGYVEGLYVSPERRHSGVARELLRASRDWARRQGCIAFASDRTGRIIVDRSFAAGG